MSGGSYNYLYSKIDELYRWVDQLTDMANNCREWASSEQSAEKWNVELRANVPTTLEDRARIVARGLLLERAAARLKHAVDEVSSLKQIMHDIEWVDSGDYGAEDLMKPLDNTESRHTAPAAERYLVHCTYCNKTHAVESTDQPCAPGAWLSPDPIR